MHRIIVGAIAALCAIAAVKADGINIPAPSWAYAITSLGTGIATALGVNVGTAGAPVINGGALGTPSSGTATNLTNIPVANATGTLPAANGGAGTINGALKANGSGTVAQAASTDLSDTTAATTFVPADTSGAALSFTSVTGNFGKTNKMCVGQFGLTFPSTASGSAAQISLPSTCTVVTGANTVIGGCRSTAASPRATLMLFGLSNSTNAQFLATDTLTPTNANLTTAVLNCNFAYVTN